MLTSICPIGFGLIGQNDGQGAKAFQEWRGRVRRGHQFIGLPFSLLDIVNTFEHLGRCGFKGSHIEQAAILTC